MIRELDTRTIGDVVSFAEDLVRAFRADNKDTIDIISGYQASNVLIKESINLNPPEEEDRIFALAMVMIKDMYHTTHSHNLDNRYVAMGARYLLMPELQFIRRCRECNDDLFELKGYYPFISHNMLAQHVADIDRCFVCQRTGNRYHSRFAHPSISTVTLPIDVLDKIADTALETADGRYQEERTDRDVKITAWRIGINRVQFICYGEGL